MAELLARARQSLSYNQLDDAIQQLLQASTQQPLNPDVWFTLATALARKGGQPTMCCIAYLRTVQLLRADAADASSEQSPASAAMMSVSADNCWLLAGKLLPTGWPAALQDSTLNTHMCRGLLQHLDTVLQPQQQHLTMAAAADSSSSGEESCSHVQLLCVGGMGVQAMQLAAVASEAQSSAVHAAEAAAASPGSSSSEGSPCWVPSMGVAYIPGSQLTAHVASQLLLDNDLDDIVDVCSWPEFMQQQREQEPPTAVLALLAAAVQPNWGPAVTACMQACHRVAAFTSTSYSRSGRSMLSLLCPGRIRVWAVPVSCKELLDLNQVDLQGIAEHTAGRYNYAAANTRLRRSSRAAQVSRHDPVLLSAPAVVLELSLQQLLAELQQRYQSPQQRQQQGAAQTAAAAHGGTEVQSCPVAAALAGSHSVEASTVLTVQQAGQLDCLVWWLDFEWASGCHTAFAPGASAAAASVAAGAAAVGARAADVLQPHTWQHVQYLPLPGDSTHQQGLLLQGQQVDAGQQLLISVSASAADLQLTASAAANSSSAAGGPDTAVCTPAQQQQPHLRQASDPSREILPYHLSMLNDHARTVAYEKGITGAVRALLQGSQQQEAQQQESAAVQDNMQQLSLQDGGGAAAGAVPVVLDVGCGTGLLSMMAATAAAAAGGSVSIAGCEREPALAQTAGQLVADNSLQQHIRVANKLSSQLSLAGAAGSAGRKAAGAAAKAKVNGKQQQQEEADLPGKASLVVHEIFGTDPLSEHVLPALLQVQQQLAATGAVFMPGRVRVVAAVAACPRLLQSIRIADTFASVGINTNSSAAGPASASTATATAAAGSDGAVCQMPAWDVSCLLALQPRKVELQLDELRSELLLLTVPQPVLTLDFQQPIKLSGKQVVQLQALESALLLQDWMAQQQQQQQERQQLPGQYACSNSSSSSTEPAPNAAGAGSAANQGSGAPQEADDLLVLSWFEADCGEGGWLSTAPGNTRLGHWQQSVEFVRCAGPAATADRSFALQVSWNNDRVAFALGA